MVKESQGSCQYGNKIWSTLVGVGCMFGRPHFHFFAAVKGKGVNDLLDANI